MFLVTRLPIFLGLLMVVYSAEAEKRPNVLFIKSDDLTGTALGCYGNEVCLTPNIDNPAKDSWPQ